MNHITTLEDCIKRRNQVDWYLFLDVQKFLVEKHFKWISLKINMQEKSLVGKGVLNITGSKDVVLLSYSPFHSHRYDRIYIDDKTIQFNDDIHVYGGLSLCLYHPVIDQPILSKIPLYKMIPWISEWIIFYNQWKKYGVWLGKEIKHRF